MRYCCAVPNLEQSTREYFINLQEEIWGHNTIAIMRTSRRLSAQLPHKYLKQGNMYKHKHIHKFMETG